MKQMIKKISLFLLVLLILFSLGAALRGIIWIINESPDISNYKKWKPSKTTFVYAANGEVLTKLYRENRVYVPISKIPLKLQNAVIAIEDARFRRHFGIDLIGILRAIWVDLKHMAKVQGASTITQQLAKNTLLSHKKLFIRKLKEMYIALQFERMYTKDEILEFYLNEIFLGHSAYGVQSAAHFYFNKDVQNLSLSESALLAALIKAPNTYSPYNNKKLAKERRNLVLEKMSEQQYISQQQAKKAKQQPISLEQPEEDKHQLAPYFIRHVRKKLINKFGANRVFSQGLKVHTTLDPNLQKKAKQTVDQAISSGYLPTVNRQVGHGNKQPQLALVTLNPSQGTIKAMIGGRGNDKFNRVTQAHRQPGSAFKPFIYATALKQGMSPASTIEDMPQKYSTKQQSDSKQEKNWIPTNYNDKYLGPTTLRIGLAKSINVMAVKLMNKIGINNTLQVAQKLGISNLVKQDRNLATALGGLTKGVTPLEMAQAYGTFANQGVRNQPIAISKVYDRKGNLLWNNKTENKSRQELALSQEVSYLITDLLQSVVARGPIVWGTGWRAKLNRPTAGKTGTTSDYTDAWFVGYTKQLVTSIWIGEDQPARMEYKQNNNSEQEKTQTISSEEAAKLWGDYMEKATKQQPIKEFPRPDNIIKEKICIESGKLPNQYCRQNNTTRQEIFRQENKPTTKCSVHKKTDTVKIDTSTDKLATDYCPDDKVATKHYQVDTDYLVNKQGVPIKKTEEYKIEDDKKIELPVRNKQGDYIYEKVPTQKCKQHTPEDTSEKIKEKIINFFNDLAD